MQPTSIERDERNSIKMYKMIFYICATIMMVVTTYAMVESLSKYLVAGKIVIGEVLVNTEFPISNLPN
ncbi:MAG: hypothetical protein EX285_01185 [Thaumarchaeota archaeon]|nr:hypothetical protein [Nitrososphaerota archaeon]